MQWKNPNELFGQPNISRRKRTLGPSNNQTGLRTDALHTVLPVDLSDFSLSSLSLTSLQTHQTPCSPSNWPSCAQTQGLCTAVPLPGVLFLGKEGFPLSSFIAQMHPPQKALPCPPRLSKLIHVCLFYVSIMDTFRFVGFPLQTSVFLIFLIFKTYFCSEPLFLCVCICTRKSGHFRKAWTSTH